MSVCRNALWARRTRFNQITAAMRGLSLLQDPQTPRVNRPKDCNDMARPHFCSSDRKIPEIHGRIFMVIACLGGCSYGP